MRPTKHPFAFGSGCWWSLTLDINEMTDIEFQSLMKKASTAALDFARRYVTDSLPSALRFHLKLNQSNDDEVASGDRVYPDDNGVECIEATIHAVASRLLRDQRCPQWIDISVEGVGDDFTQMELLCCGRYTANSARMYYHDRGMGPFGIKSPVLPINHDGKTKFKMKRVQQCTPPTTVRLWLRWLVVADVRHEK